MFLDFAAPVSREAEKACGAGVAEKGGGAKEEKPSAAPAKGVRVPAAMAPRKSAVDKEVAARRALAVKRVMEDNCGGDNNDTVREFSLFVTSRGAKGVVVLLHGLNEHSGRYSVFAKKLNANGIKVYGMDWIVEGQKNKTGKGRHDSNPYFVLCLTGENTEWSWTSYALQTQQPRLSFSWPDMVEATGCMYVHSLDYAVNDMVWSFDPHNSVQNNFMLNNYHMHGFCYLIDCTSY
ncbi:UNVERIFIED_CONTAM: hypothetical protein Scaly_2672200 [Sesamum calycinum]|uniref:Serine aminopeptidase S33 domain-containing protein n=1 Tax=Sesamum calycinum TaxID=2727403 RepID=A0AAW2J6Q7_9LAMI